MTAFPQTASDTGATITESIVSRRNRVISDTGETQTDSLVRGTISLHVVISDTGATITDTIPKHEYHSIADTGTTITDSPVRVVVPGPNAVFTYLCSRNWNYIENQSGWSADAFARFSYSTIPD